MVQKGRRLMIETECQALIQHAVEAAGGRALRFNNRFLVGVADLLIQLPARRAVILEAKLITLSPKTTSHVWDVGCTDRQKAFLRDWHNAGMLTGVVSFVQHHGVGLKSLQIGLFEYTLIERGAYIQQMPMKWHVRLEQHKPLGDKATRFHNITDRLSRFVDGVNDGY